MFSLKTGLDRACKLSPLETICMYCPVLSSWQSMKVSLLSSAIVCYCCIMQYFNIDLSRVLIVRLSHKERNYVWAGIMCLRKIDNASSCRFMGHGGKFSSFGTRTPVKVKFHAILLHFCNSNAKSDRMCNQWWLAFSSEHDIILSFHDPYHPTHIHAPSHLPTARNGCEWVFVCEHGAG